MIVSTEDFKKVLHEPDKYSDHEIELAVKIVNWLRPFTPKQDLEGKLVSHPLTLGPFCYIANNILKAIGYKDFTRRLSPMSACGKRLPIPLSAAGICEILCAGQGGHFDACLDGRVHSTVPDASKPTSRRVIFSAFFDMEAIVKICNEYNLVFGDR